MIWLGVLKRFWKPLAGAVLVLALWTLVAHRERVSFASGYQQAVSENAKAVAKQQIENAKKEAADAKRIVDAYRARDESEAQLAAIRAQPRTSVMCHRTPDSRDRVSEAARLSNAETAGAGVLSREDPPGAESDFDPSPELYDTADEADSLVADCRMLHQAVFGIPSTLPARVPAH